MTNTDNAREETMLEMDRRQRTIIDSLHNEVVEVRKDFAAQSEAYQKLHDQYLAARSRIGEIAELIAEMRQTIEDLYMTVEEAETAVSDLNMAKPKREDDDADESIEGLVAIPGG